MNAPLEDLVAQLRRELGDVSDTYFGLELLHYVERLNETKDPNWVDLMVWRVLSEGLPMPISLQILAARVAHRRLLGAGSRNKVSRVFKEHTNHLAMIITASLDKLIGRQHAANQAAKAVFAVCGYSKNGASIAKDFPNFERKVPVADKLRKRLEKEAEASTEDFLKLQDALKPLNDRSGTRR